MTTKASNSVLNLVSPPIDELVLATPLVVSSGGTGRDELLPGIVVIGNGTGPVAGALPGTAGLPLVSNGLGLAPSFQTIDVAAITGLDAFGGDLIINLQTGVTGVLAVDHGGTGFAGPYPNGAILTGDSVSEPDDFVGYINPTTAGFPLVSNGPGLVASFQSFINIDTAEVLHLVINGVEFIPRIVIPTSTDYYVSTAGGASDANDGSIGSPWATLQHAWNYLTTIDLGGHGVTVHVGDGTYAGFVAGAPLVGQPDLTSVVFEGDITTPANCTISAVNAPCVVALDGASFFLRGFYLTATGTTGLAGAGIIASRSASILFTHVEFGACARAHFYANSAGSVVAVAPNYIISGSAPYHMAADLNGVTQIDGTPGTPCVVSIFNALTFSRAFAVCTRGGNMTVNGLGVIYTGSGTVTGTLKYEVSGTGVMDVDSEFPSGDAANYLPGDTPGVVDAGTYGVFV